MYMAPSPPRGMPQQPRPPQPQTGGSGPPEGLVEYGHFSYERSFNANTTNNNTLN